MNSAAAIAAGVVATGSAASADETAPTFYKDVLPIFQNHCNECHRQGQLAPMALDDYSAIRPWIKSIRRSVSEGEMPPWFADKAHGEWVNDISLNDEQIQTINRWVAAGALEGDKADAPAPKQFNDSWVLGEPDEVFTMPKAHTLAAEGKDEYKYFTIPTNFTEDRWITSLEVMPGNREIVHHVIVFVKEAGKENEGVGSETGGTNTRGEGGPVENNSFRPESQEKLDEIIARQERFLEMQTRKTRREAPLRLMGMIGGMAPGMPPWQAHPGEGRLLKAGSVLVFQMHYHPSGNEGTDQTSIGVKYAQEPIRKQVYTTGIFNIAFAIPPGADDFDVRAEHTINEPIKVLSFMPHMHLRGKAFRYTAIYPDGREQILLNVPRYDFNWQLVYECKEPLALPTRYSPSARHTLERRADF